MKNRKMRITEIAKDMCFHADSCIVGVENHCCERNCETTWLAEKLIDLNYQKIDKDSIVLSKEEYERNLNNSFNFGKEENKKYYDNHVVPQKIRETAKDIINELECFFWETAINDTKYFDLYESLYRSIKEHFKNKYGVTKEN